MRWIVEAESLKNVAEGHRVVIRPLVGCKDCKHLTIINKRPVYAVCERSNLAFYLWEEDMLAHFCLWGERREDGEV